jgi:DNA-binding beta-propeller fold protein YncE
LKTEKRFGARRNKSFERCKVKIKIAMVVLGAVIGSAWPLRAQFVYVANFGGTNVSAYSINSNGGLTPVPGSPFAAGNGPFSVAVDPLGKFVYVANIFANNVSAYSISSDGALTPVPGSPFATGVLPASVVVDPSGKFAYVANANDNNVSAYSIGSNGGLTPVGSPFASGVTPVSIAVDPTSKSVFVYVVNSVGPLNGTVSAYSIGSNGGLIPVAGSPFGGPEDLGGFPNSIAIDPTGQFAYVVSENESSISAFIIGPTGTLNDVAGWNVFDTGAIPVSVIVDPTGKFAYVANSSDNDVSGYVIDSKGGLTPVPGSPFAAGGDPRSVVVDPTGKFVYVANSSTNNVSAYSIGSNGALTPVPVSPFAAGFNPSSIAITPLVPFASSFVKLEIEKGRFDLNESFTLGANTNGINPVTEKVTLQIGTFSVTIPAGSFRQNPNGRFAFQGVINGASLQVQTVPLGNNIFTFKAEGTGVKLTGLTNPVTVELTIGIDSGSTTVTAQLD